DVPRYTERTYGIKPTAPRTEEYRRRHEDSRSVAPYQTSLHSQKAPRDLLDPRRSLGWILTLAERRAISGLIRRTKITGLILAMPCRTGKLNALLNSRFSNSSAGMLDRGSGRNHEVPDTFRGLCLV